MEIKSGLFYSKTHEWVDFISDTRARVGISDYAQNAMGDIVFVNLPAEGDAVAEGEAFADLESVKAVEDVLSPLSGTVAAVNQEAYDAPESINQDPYGTWLIEVEYADKPSDLMTAEQYEAHCKEEE